MPGWPKFAGYRDPAASGACCVGKQVVVPAYYLAAMALGDIDAPAVLKAIAECREIGSQEFLRRYGFGRARAYALVFEGDAFDSKAIVGAAHRYATAAVPARTAFRGGEGTVVKRLRDLGFTIESVDSLSGQRTGSPEARDLLVLIAPSYGNPATRRRFHDTLAQPVDFTVPRLWGLLATADGDALYARHPEGAARFWGALAHHNSTIDRLRDGDVVVFTGDNRIQAVAIMGYRFRNPALADALWPPKPPVCQGELRPAVHSKSAGQGEFRIESVDYCC